MEQLKMNGMVEIEGMKFHSIEGGFGEDKKSILVKDIAEIHNREIKVINQNINRNRKRFKDNIDIIDLKGSEFEVILSDHEIYSQNSINRANNLYLLSERGYSKLLKIMDDDIAWEKYDLLIDNYFNMRQAIKQISEKDKLLLGLFSDDKMTVVESHKKLIELEKKPLIEKIERDKPLVNFANTITESSDSIDIGTFAKLIKEQGIKLGRNKLFEWLRDNKYLRHNNEPYQRYIDNKVFEIKEYNIKTPYKEFIQIKTLITGKGQVYIVEKLRKSM